MNNNCKKCIYDSESLSPVCMTCEDCKSNFIDKNSEEGQKILAEQEQDRINFSKILDDAKHMRFKDGHLVEVKSKKELIQDIENAFEEKDELIKDLREEIAKLKSGEVKEKKPIRRSLQDLSKKEQIDIQNFRNEHYKKCNNSGHYQYDIVGTGIGETIKIKCPICGEERDVTDIGSW